MPGLACQFCPMESAFSPLCHHDDAKLVGSVEARAIVSWQIFLRTFAEQNQIFENTSAFSFQSLSVSLPRSAVSLDWRRNLKVISKIRFTGTGKLIHLVNIYKSRF